MIEEYLLEDGSVGYSLPDLRPIAYALGAIVIAAALVIVVINKIRPW